MKWRECQAPPVKGAKFIIEYEYGGYAYAHCKCGHWHLTEENEIYKYDGVYHGWRECSPRSRKERR